ncbi:hypothetical protein Tco_0639960 [Tanacetum coccineum]
MRLSLRSGKTEWKGLSLVTYETVIKEWEDRMERAVTTAFSLEADSIKYALTVNPTVYESCIQQFWATAKAKTINGERQIQALVDKKKVIFTEKSVRSDLMLEDAEGTECNGYLKKGQKQSQHDKTEHGNEKSMKSKKVKVKVNKEVNQVKVNSQRRSRNLHFELSFADALLHMPKFAPMFRKLLNNKDKIIDLIETPGGDFILEEIEACLTSESIPPGIDDADFDPKEDLLTLERLLNSDPTSTLPPEEQKFEELKTVEPSSDEPPELELKDLPPHLEYAFLEGTDKLPVIIAKDLKDEDKTALLKVLRSHKRAIAWKMSDIKGIDPKFCTHKILMEDNVKPTVQHQRRVNPKIHEVIKKEVIKLLEAGLIYPISDSPWVSPVHCVPKKCGITVIENDDNELIPT